MTPMRIGTNGRSPWKNQNPRYVAYCIAHGADSPQAQKSLDSTLHSGRWTRPYVAWIDQRTADWCEETGVIRFSMGWADHQRFDAWLAEKYPTDF
jgi:hypothetical protein